ncbi:hypothetical protein WK24_13115 [Burkholderia vietnamiensis]|uniref:hypothetical protein n=1 Tax=Burkholderia vietnamiensis TaxID=60552 RepID=UPI0007537586|nr:hypothetical protein [Burkholderia vietnamiensis]KVR67893.1 hypothetical protein WK24_13115 [Burkholderia vietnamiensis]
MKLYENIVIGNFLYALGFAVRARRPSEVTASAINLLQQTPADTLLGDLLLEFPGVVRLIEFKAEDNRASKERGRHRKLSAGLEGNPELQAVSRDVHWYVETASSAEHGVLARVVPYLDAFPREKAKRDRLETFIERLAQEVAEDRSRIRADREAAYLRWVKMTQGDGVVGSGGLILVADADGSLHYAQLLDMLEMRLSHWQWIDLHQKRLERELVLERELERRLELRHEKSMKGPTLTR